MSISINLPTATETLVMDAAKRSGKEVGQFVANFIEENFGPGESRQEAASKRTNVLSKEETALFKVINKGFSDEFWNRVHYLNRAREEEKITEDELAEAIRLNRKLERQNVNRLKAVAELAKIRNTTFMDLMTKLGLLNVPSF